MNHRIPRELLQILHSTPELHRCYLVGGCVRDSLLNMPINDFDLEVYGIDFDKLQRALQRWGRTDLVGRSFGIVKLRLASGEVYDFALPRRDSKTAPGHKGFEIDCDPDLSMEEASARRDFTINALFWDPREGRVIDLHGGEPDLKARRLRHTSSAFAEDPLRVLRGMQFVARFGLSPAEETVRLCREIVGSHDELARERVREEWWKWATLSRWPAAGLRFLEATSWLQHYPELDRIRGVPQDPEWHPEGDVWVHTLHCLDALALSEEWRTSDEERRGILMYAILTHDFGKAVSTVQQEQNGRVRWISPGHESQSVTLAESFFERIQLPESFRKRILPLVAQHMAHLVEPSPRAVRRLANRLAPSTIQDLAVVMTADASGRPPKPANVPPFVTALLAKADELALASQAPQPILQGRHLLQFGMTPGPKMGVLLQAAFQAQLDGEFQDLSGAQAWLVHQLKVTVAGEG